MSKRKYDYEINIESKFQKLNLNHQINNRYICNIHNDCPQICRIYECSGFYKNNQENLIKYYLK